MHYVTAEVLDVLGSDLSHRVISLFNFLVLSTSISATVSGSGRPLVSGSFKASSPPVSPRNPKTKNWRPGLASPAITIKGARMAPILANPDTRPMAELRMLVANTSPDIRYKMLKEAAMHILPRRARLVAKAEPWTI